ncbi:MAG: CTP synthase [Candidatus Nealsonbacteria bacterium]|nr:CTP synthase [Candidatus Nealsonbacteria bacterium]
MTKYIFVAGGVMSGIGKGVALASIGRILKSKGFKVAAIKIDPYVNVDAGTMNPIEHGEIFVTNDGTECDQDIGNYERFLDENLTTDNYITTGRVYQAVINRERNLGYKGRCVEVVPDIPNEVLDRIDKAALSRVNTFQNQDKKNGLAADFVLIEIGGTVGEYQNMLFLEAARIIKTKKPKKVLFALVGYLPILETTGEMKTKPIQHAVRTLNEAGIQPDIILGRSRIPLDEPRKRKISCFCNVDIKDIISAPDVETIYEIPINFEKENLSKRILRKFNLKSKKPDLQDWQKLIKTVKTVNLVKSQQGTRGTQRKQTSNVVKIGIVGKYFETGKFVLKDSYISVIEAIKHAAWFHKRKPEICWLSAEYYEKNLKKLRELKEYDGVIVPGGFGSRGKEGKIKAIEFCRKRKIPFLGLCLGMQMAVVEFARNVCGLKEADSVEFFPGCKHPVIDVMPEQKALLREKKYGGTMRLGAYNCKISDKTISFRAYGCSEVSERHRHRYELNNEFRSDLEANGLTMAGINPEKNLVEIIELKTHPFFVGVQFHPEYKSRPLRPHPLFREFIKSILNSKRI